MKIRNLLINLLFLLISILLVFFVIEGYFRIFNPQIITPVKYKEDPVYGMKMIPGLKGYSRSPEFTISFQLNSMGFRDKERNKFKSENIYRIIGLGDSFSWGAGVKRNETFLVKLEDSLNRNSDKVKYEVFNWGVSAWGTAQQLLCLKTQALEYYPDLIIMQYFKGNDINDNLYSNLFRISSEGELVPSNYAWQRIRKIKKIVNNLPFYRFLVQHSHFISAIRFRLISVVMGKDEKSIDAALSVSAHKEYGLQLTEKILEEFFSVVNKDGIKIIMLVFPDKYEFQNDFVKLSLAQKKKYFRESKMIADVCQRYNIPLFDFTNIFNQDQIPRIYYLLDSHLTPYGHRLVFEVLEKYIRENFL